MENNNRVCTEITHLDSHGVARDHVGLDAVSAALVGEASDLPVGFKTVLQQGGSEAEGTAGRFLRADFHSGERDLNGFTE